MLPDVYAQNGNHAAANDRHQRVVLVGGGDDHYLSVLHDKPRPSGTEHAPGSISKSGLGEGGGSVDMLSVVQASWPRHLFYGNDYLEHVVRESQADYRGQGQQGVSASIAGYTGNVFPVR